MNADRFLGAGSVEILGGNLVSMRVLASEPQRTRISQQKGEQEATEETETVRRDERACERAALARSGWWQQLPDGSWETKSRTPLSLLASVQKIWALAPRFRAIPVSK